MTIVVALKDEKNKKIYLGADTKATISDITVEPICKLMKIEIPLSNGEVDSIYIGFSGNIIFYQYLLNVFQAPEFPVETNFLNYMYRFFLKELKEELKEQNLVDLEGNVINTEIELIIIHDGNIYAIYDDFSIIEVTRNYECVGSGHRIASAIIENKFNFYPEMDFKEIISESLYTTGKMNIYCNTDYEVLTITY